MTVRILIGDCRERLRELPDASVDSVVCDPPYHLTAQGSKRTNLSQPADKDLTKINAGAFRRMAKGFMGQTWDGGDVAFQPDTWAEVLRVLKPGGHLVAFSGTRTYHRMVCAIEDAGFEVRDQLAWVYGSGFPKSLDVSKQIDKMAGAEREVVGVKTEPSGRNRLKEARGVVDRNTWGDNGSGFRESEEKRLLTAPATDAAREWQGWGTALKPSWEPICLARKPLSEGSVAANVLRWGCGAIHIDACRISSPCNPYDEGDGSTAGTFVSHTDGHENHIPNTGQAASFERGRGHRKSPHANGSSNAHLDLGLLGSQSDYLACHRSDDAQPHPGEAIGQDEAPSCADAPGLPGHLPAGSDTPLSQSKACPDNININAGSEAKRWPSNLCHDGSEEVLAGFPDLGAAGQHVGRNRNGDDRPGGYDGGWLKDTRDVGFNDSGSAARFFYCAKATTEERGEGNNHPTVKPVSLMRWLVRLVTPKGGTVLDPFMGSGSTALACDAEQFNFIGCEMSPEYAAIAEKRIRDAAGMFAEVVLDRAA